MVCTCWASLVLKASRSNSTAAEGSTNLRVEPTIRANRQRSSCMKAMFLLSYQNMPVSLDPRNWRDRFVGSSCLWTHRMTLTLLQNSLRQTVVENQPSEDRQVEQRLQRHNRNHKGEADQRRPSISGARLQERQPGPSPTSTGTSKSPGLDPNL